MHSELEIHHDIGPAEKMTKLLGLAVIQKGKGAKKYGKPGRTEKLKKGRLWMKYEDAGMWE